MTNPREKRQTPPREFWITPKTTHGFLVENYRGVGRNNVWVKVAEDIAKNAEELEEGIDWKKILDHDLFADLYITNSMGINAIAHTIAHPVATIAVNMGWDMDSPEIVYISGFYFYQHFKNRADYLEEQHNNLTRRIFLTDEDRQRTFAQEQLEAERTKADSQKLKNALDEYARQSLSQDPNYLIVIQSLLYLYSSISDKQKRREIFKDVFELLKRGNSLACHELICQYTS